MVIDGKAPKIWRYKKCVYKRMNQSCRLWYVSGSEEQSCLLWILLLWKILWKGEQGMPCEVRCCKD